MMYFLIKATITQSCALRYFKMKHLGKKTTQSSTKKMQSFGSLDLLTLIVFMF